MPDPVTPVVVPVPQTTTPVVGGGNPSTVPVASTAPDTFTIKVKGVEKSVTRDELIALAQKNDFVEQRAQELSDREKSLGEASKAYELLRKSRTGDKDASRVLAREFLGYSEDEIKAVFDAAVGGTAPSPTTTQTPTQAKPPELKDLPPEVQRAVQIVMTKDKDEALVEIRNQVREKLASDKVLGHTLNRDKERLTAVSQYVELVLRRRVQEGKPYGPELLADTVQEARVFAKQAGILGSADGTTPGSYHTTGLGPTGSLTFEGFHPDQAPVTRPPITGDANERIKYLLSRAGQIAFGGSD